MKAFKEWEGVCQALESGQQSLILRKGGIHEGRDGFAFGAESFVIFPTRFHGQSDCLKVAGPEAKPEWQVGDEVTITHYAETLWAETLSDWDAVNSLADYHVWTEQTIRDRFDWEGKGMPTSRIHCALIRVWKLASPWTLTYEKRHGGCRSWLDLDDVPEDLLEGKTAVLGEDDFDRLSGEVESLVGR